MAITIRVIDGDFRRDGLGRFLTVTGRDLLSQHVREELANSIRVTGLSDLGDRFLDFIEGLLSMRIRTRLEELKKDLDQVGVDRNLSEVIREVREIVVKRSKVDPRTVRFWVKVVNGELSAIEIAGGD